TMANANGEIRGNTSRMLCTMIPQSVGSLGDVSVITKLYPNPAYNSATLDISSSAQTNTTILLYDVMGRLVWSTEKTLAYGNSRVQIPLDNLTAGMYSVQIRSNTGQISLKLSKQ
ncbi:MAG: T9SS type A sorting domain-containing protein, partial [Taibaiella sp.]|nr:T9SS type A sorting domain-containing protein [Taibaiella sp.]